MASLFLLLQIGLGVALLAVAALTALRPKRLDGLMATTPATVWGSRAFALFCFVAGVATLAGAAIPFVAFFASCIAFAASCIATVRARAGGASGFRIGPLALAFASVAIAAGQPLGLKVLALPKADDLPYAPVAARVVKTYDEGLWFEGIAAGPDGTLYLAGNRGLDFSRADYYRKAEGEIIARTTEGAERILFRTPKGSAAGVIAVAPDGTLYMTSNGDEPGIWRIRGGGKGELFVRLPRGAWPNGLDFGGDGNLYAADSNMGVIWRTDPQTGKTEKAVEDKRLLARPFISLAPGANGLHFDGARMIVTVSDKTTVLAYELKSDGTFTEPRVLASGIPGDDFAIGTDGALFITTHPNNTLVRVSPSGERTVVANDRQHIVGATDAVFGRGPTDRGTLYVVTDGGAFTGGPMTRGELVALKP